MKESIVVFAVAAAFAGGVVAQVTDTCRTDVGWWTVSTTSPGPTGATLATINNTGEFAQKTGTKMVDSCTVPKTKTVSIVINRRMSVDECSVYNDLAGADSKLAVGKLPDAQQKLGFLYTKINTIAGDGKLSPGGASAIGGAVQKAWQCVTDLIAVQ